MKMMVVALLTIVTLTSGQPIEGMGPDKRQMIRAGDFYHPIPKATTIERDINDGNNKLILPKLCLIRNLNWSFLFRTLQALKMLLNGPVLMTTSQALPLRLNLKALIFYLWDFYLSLIYYELHNISYHERRINTSIYLTEIVKKMLRSDKCTLFCLGRKYDKVHF